MSERRQLHILSLLLITSGKAPSHQSWIWLREDVGTSESTFAVADLLRQRNVIPIQYDAPEKKLHIVTRTWCYCTVIAKEKNASGKRESALTAMKGIYTLRLSWTIEKRERRVCQKH